MVTSLGGPFEIGSGVVIDYDTDHTDTTHIGYTFAIYVHFIMGGMPPGEGVLGEQGLVMMYNMWRVDCEYSIG